MRRDLGRLLKLSNQAGNMIHSAKNKDFWSDRIVSKLVAAITYETRYRAEKAEHIYVFRFTVSHNLEVPKTKSFGTIKCTK